MAATKTSSKLKIEEPKHVNPHQRFPTMMLNITNDADRIRASEMHSFKVLVLGQSRTGKTSIVRRFVQNTFISTYKMTFGAAQWHFKCQVPVNLMEEIPKDANLLHSMTSFFNMDSTDNILDELKEEMANEDPFDDDDKNAEFGGFDALNAPQNLRVSSIADYGSFSAPQIFEENDIRKTSVNLNINLEIIDVGFHPTEDQLYDDVNSIILVIDYSNKDSITESINKYEAFLKHLKYEKREYIPLIIAANKCDIQKKDKEFKKKYVKSVIKKHLMPIMNEHFAEDDVGIKNKVKKQQNYGNATLLSAPDLSFVYDGNDKNRDSDIEQSDNEDNDDDEARKSFKDSLNEQKQKEKKSKKLTKDDVRYINVISCSAKTGRNIEKVFESCIKKTLPSKLSQSVKHSRQQTTAHVTAPIWLRNLVTDFQQNRSSSNHPYFDIEQLQETVDDNFDFIEDDK